MMTFNPASQLKWGQSPWAIVEPSRDAAINVKRVLEATTRRSAS